MCLSSECLRWELDRKCRSVGGNGVVPWRLQSSSFPCVVASLRFDEPGERREGHFMRRKCEFPNGVPLNVDGSVLARFKFSELECLDVAGFFCIVASLHAGVSILEVHIRTLLLATRFTNTCLSPFTCYCFRCDGGICLRTKSFFFTSFIALMSCAWAPQTSPSDQVRAVRSLEPEIWI